mgnify:CR=1 FL=1
MLARELEDAERDGDRIYGVIRSVGTSSDGRAKSIYAPLPAGQARALRDAYEQAGVSPSDIELVEAHGTGTSAGDACEFEALRDVYEEEPGLASWVALGSVKSQIGHTKAAAGAAGLIKATLALHHKVIPPTIKVDAPNPGMDLETSPFFLPLEARPWSAKDEAPRRAAVSSFGFGGSDFHMVVEEYRRQRVAPAWDGAVQIAPLSGASVGALLEGLDQLSSGDYRHACAAARRTFDSGAARRLVLVASSASELAERIAAARSKLQESPDVAWTMPMGAHYGLGTPDGDVAVVFPGQGSQYPGMLGGLAAVFPEFLEALSEDQAITATLFPPSTFSEQEKKKRETKRRAAVTRVEVKELKMRYNIDVHDYQVKTKAMHRFFEAGADLARASVAQFNPTHYTGEWSFRHEMDRAGVEFFTGDAPSGSVIAAPTHSSPGELPTGLVEVGRISAEESFGPRVLNESLQIGLYAETLGALPIGWSDMPIEEVVAWQVP